jgi:predicted Zn-dependent protease with MMP-like domain
MAVRPLRKEIPVEDLDTNLEAIEAALESGDVDEALRLAKATRKHFPAEPDAHLAYGDALWDAGDLAAAREAYENAARLAPDSPDILATLGWAHFALLDFEAARKAATRSTNIDENASATALLGHLAERDGDLAAGDQKARRANALDPEGFPLPFRLPEDDFREAVSEALDRLPEEFRQAVDGEVAVLVEPVPRVELLRSGEPAFDPEILGLYVGVPLPERENSTSPPKLPDVVYLFQRNLEHAGTTREEIVDEIAVTVFHEIGHYLGYDDDELEERGIG